MIVLVFVADVFIVDLIVVDVVVAGLLDVVFFTSFILRVGVAVVTLSYAMIDTVVRLAVTFVDPFFSNEISVDFMICCCGG